MLFFLSVFVSLECIEEYLKKKKDSVTFSPQNWALKFLRWPSPTKMTKSCFSGSSTGRDVTSGIVYSPRQCISMFHCISLQTQSFFGLFTPKMIDFVWKNNETLKWRVGDPWSDVMACFGPRLSNFRSSSLGVADARFFKAQFCGENMKESNFFFKTLF